MEVTLEVLKPTAGGIACCTFLGFELDELGVIGNRLVVLALTGVGVSAVGVVGPIFWIELDGLGVIGNRQVVLALLKIRSAAAGVKGPVLWSGVFNRRSLLRGLSGLMLKSLFHNEFALKGLMQVKNAIFRSP